MSDVEPVTEAAPRRIRPGLLRTNWRDVAFLHWTLAPAAAAALLPPGTRPDLFDGVSYVGVVGLGMCRTAPLGVPAVPWLGSFGEVNVRLYSVDEHGRRGIVFVRMEADRLLPVLVGRTLRLPYIWSRTRVTGDGDRRLYSISPHIGTARARIALRIGPHRDPDPLETFLTARWGVHVRVGRRTLYLPIAHPPLPLHPAELVECDANLLQAAGLPGVDGAPSSVLYSPGVDGVRFGPPLR